MTREELEKAGWVWTHRSIADRFTLEGRFQPDWQSHAMSDVFMMYEYNTQWCKIEARFSLGEHEVIFDGRVASPLELHIIMVMTGILNNKL